MTNPMLAELDAVVRQLHEVDGKEGLVLEKMRMLSTAGLFIKAHHATLADMAKRLEAAERDARRYRFIESAPSGTVRADFVSWLPAYFHFGNGISLGEQLDAAIAATQEGEG